jgi:hypothetical protein
LSLSIATWANALVFEELDEIDGEEAFADTAFAVKDENQSFHVDCGVSLRTCAMRGPRVRAGDVSSPLELAEGSAGALAFADWH